MLRNTQDLIGDKIHAVDGDIGRVASVLFDDRDWRVRYLAVDTGGWLGGREVLIPAPALDAARSSERRLAVALTRETIESAPGVGADPPAEQRHAEAQAKHGGLSLFWAPPEEAELSARERTEQRERRLREAEARAANANLHSSRALRHYAVRGPDAPLGRLADLRIDDASWTVSDLVVEAHDGRTWQVPPQAVETIDWKAREIRLRGAPPG